LPRAFAVVGAQSLEFFYILKHVCILIVKTYNDDEFERFDPDVDPLQRKLIW